MKETKEEYYSLADIIKATRVFSKYIMKKWWILLLSLIIGGILGVVYFSIQKPRYEAVCTFVLEEKQGGGGLSGIASQIGIDLGGLTGGGSLFSGDNILDILKSKKVVTQVLLSKTENADANADKLIDLYLDYTGKRRELEKRNASAISFKSIGTELTPSQDSIVNVAYSEIIKKNLSADRINKKGTIIKVMVTAENSVFAKYLSERLVDEASKMYLNIKTGTALNNISRLQRRSDSLLALLNNKSYVAASSQLLDVNPGIRTAAVPVEIASRDKAVIGTLYTEVTKNLELSKMMLAQQTPIIQLLDKPGIILDDNKKGMAFLVVVLGFIAMFIAFCFLTLRYFLQNI